MELDKRPVCAWKSLRNWAVLCVLLSVALLFYHDPLLILWWPEKNNTDGLPLDMATESIDDMYDGCRSEAASMIDQFGVFEWHFNQAFAFYWASAERGAKKPLHKQLKEEHATVIYMYTKVKYIQQTFNKAVITGKHKYSTNKFKFHYFYFYLVDAIQILHHKHKPCRTTYHRTWRQYNHNVIDTNMRFGGFILTGLTKQSSVFNGNVSCFEIQTCSGADVAYYSATKQMGQVLIPPYEVFRITDVLTSDPWCRVVYKLQSTKIPRTDLNCKLNHNEISTYLGVVTTHSDSTSAAVMVTYLILWIIISSVLIQLGQLCFVATVNGALLVLTVIAVMLRVGQ